MAASLEDLERRVTALENAQSNTTESLRWVVTKLARAQAVQDEHTLRLDRIEAKLERVSTDVGGLQSELVKLRGDLPGLVGDVMRQVLRESRGR